MLLADRKALEANLARGTLTIQYRLITLYSHNLSYLGTNAALIANLSILAIVETDFPSHNDEFEPHNSRIYYVCCIVAACSAFVALTQSVMEVIWVPSKALSGTESEEVMKAVSHMKYQQRDSMIYGSCAGTFLMFAKFLFILGYSGANVACTCGAILLVLYVWMIRSALQAINIFDTERMWKEQQAETYGSVPDEDDDDRERCDSTGELSAKDNFKLVAQRIFTGANSAEQDRVRLQGETFQQQIKEKREKLTRISCKGTVWTKNFGVEKQIRHKCFRKAYLVLENGGIDFYKSKQAYEGNENSDNAIPILLSAYEIETDARIINQTAAKSLSATGSLRGAVMGSDELSFMDNIKADFSVSYATQNLKFSLMPKESNEMQASEVLHFMTEDDMAYNQWLSVLRSVIGVYRDIDRINAEIVHSRGTTNVQNAIAESTK